MQDKQLEALEATIDSIGLTALVEAIASICREKGEHIIASYSNGEDDPLGNAWYAAADALEAALEKVNV